MLSFLLEVELTLDLGVAYFAMLLMALLPIYIGAHLSLQQKEVETMSAEDAWKFPLVGSGVLFGLYLLFKVFSKEYINMLLTGYFLLFGILAMGVTLKPLFTPFFSSPKIWKFAFNPPWEAKEPFKFEFDVADLVSFVASIGIGIWYVMTKHWISNNILGLSFSIQGISLLALGSYKIGCILLGGLFFL